MSTCNKTEIGVSRNISHNPLRLITAMLTKIVTGGGCIYSWHRTVAWLAGPPMTRRLADQAELIHDDKWRWLDDNRGTSEWHHRCGQGGLCHLQISLLHASSHVHRDDGGARQMSGCFDLPALTLSSSRSARHYHTILPPFFRSLLPLSPTVLCLSHGVVSSCAVHVKITRHVTRRRRLVQDGCAAHTGRVSLFVSSCIIHHFMHEWVCKCLRKYVFLATLQWLLISERTDHK